MASMFKKKTDAKLELLTQRDMLLMVEKGIRGGLCHAIHRYAKANNKYMRNYDENEESLFLEYLDANNLYGKKVGLNHFKDPKAFMEYSNDIQDVYKNIEYYNPGKKRKIIIVLDDMIADMINNKKLNPIVT